MKHYFKDGTEFTGRMHKMPNGKMHSGVNHTKSSKPVVHFNNLSKIAKKKAKLNG